jgi:YggT family protein
MPIVRSSMQSAFASRAIVTHQPTALPASVSSISKRHYASICCSRRRRRSTIPCALLDPATVGSTAPASTAQAIYEVAALNSATAGAIAAILRPTLSIGSLLMIVRIVLTWYPEVDAKKLPWSIAYAPTEPLLAATRKVVKPFNGLDVSPIVWVAILSFLSEILTGPQGILSLIQRKAGM